MEVVTATPNGGGVPPFHDHDVREWSRIDSITGALERARLETDHWSANTINSSHKYGKVVDLRARSNADGALQQQARRQLEVFQSQIPGGHLQVIKTHTVSSSRWTNKTPVGGDGFGSKDFENLQLSLNPLDLSSQKSKASVGRSVSRRPPTRQRSREPPEPNSSIRNPHLTAATNLHRVSRLCHQIHETAVRQAFGKRSSPRPSINDRENGDGSVEIYEIESVSSSETKSINGHTNLTRTKSTSSDIYVVPEKDSPTKSVEDLEDLEQLQNWRRTSKIRRSLQFPKQNKSTVSSSKPVDLPENSVSVRQIREDLEKGRRLNTALRNNSVDLEALDQILQSISSSSSIHSDKTSDNTDDIENEQSSRKQKRNSFVTVESIKEVKGRLRRTSSPTSDIYRNQDRDVDADDGIVTEDSTTNSKEMPVIDKPPNQSRVRSYVYGMEALLNKKPGIGTGSLESRGKSITNNVNSRSDDWYNRRKSYGFEQVHNPEESINSISLKNKNLVESSTDSGICRSTEIVVVPTPTRTNSYKEDASENSDEENKYRGYESRLNNEISPGQVRKMANSFNYDNPKPSYNKITNEELTKNLSGKFTHYKANDWSGNDTELKSTTITIPIVKNNNVVDLFWNDHPDKEIKRHSIAVDESKYVIKNNNGNNYRRTSLALNNEDEDDNNINRRTKKVEFCKTEVHFAADSGKVNIVATDEKPPPTQNFRRRRRATGFINEDFNKNGLPVLHFGDSSYEKTMFGVADNLEDTKTTNFTSVNENVSSRVPSTYGVVTVNTNNNTSNEFTDMITEDEKKEQSENESIKGILKNKPIKPKPYHLGETIPFSDTNSDDENKNWGVKLKHVEADETPIWKSTVTVHNYYDKQPSNDLNGNERDQPEFQKLLKNLRPTRKPDYTSDNDNRYTDNFVKSSVSHLKDNRRSSWSISDKTKPIDDSQSNEIKGYSTKVNFGEGETIVVESDGLYEKERHPTWPRAENSTKDTKQRLITSETTSNSDVYSNSSKYLNSNNDNTSSVILSKAIPVISKPELTAAVTTKKLASPFLVGRNSNTFDYSEKLNIKQPSENGRHSPSKEFKNNFDKKIKTKHINDNVVLRQPKKSEMTYFGINLSPKPVKKISQAVIRKENKLSVKPDLLQHYKKSPSPGRNIKPKDKPRMKSPEVAKENTEPIYENLKEPKGKYSSREFDSSILDELTKAADQILQAVNGYTDEDSHNRYSTDDENMRKGIRNEKLETISETKSLKQQKLQNTKSKPPNTKTKLKHTSSTSSVESLSQRKVTSSSIERKSTATKTTLERSRNKIEKNEGTSTTNSIKANTKARRLQRASSREALLQSHGSSSEDLTASVEAPVRKPRLIKKTKAMHLTVTNGVELKKPTNSIGRKKEESSNKSEDRVLSSLPEIRHKTAVSTIRSTTDRSTRDKTLTRHRSEDLKKVPQKREGSRGMTPSTRDREKSKNATLHKETVTHRISTANIKKCHRTDGGTKH